MKDGSKTWGEAVLILEVKATGVCGWVILALWKLFSISVQKKALFACDVDKLHTII